jgi:L-lactate dehydrogenase (cytochrome)
MRFAADRPLGVAPATVLDYRELARRRLPRQLFDYVDGGAYEEATMRRNVADLEAVLLRQVVMRDVSVRDPGVEVLGQRLALPIALAPVGLGGMLAPRAEVQAARAAEAAGVPFVESTVSICGIEEVAKATTAPPWFQLYVMRDRELGKSMMQRAKAAGCCALVITVDLQMQGQRDRDVRNGLTIPPQLRFASAVDFALHPGWVWRLLTGPKVTLANFAGSGKGGDLFTIAEFVNSQFDASVTWKDIDWVRSVWDGPLALKGILDAEDARLAVEHGIEAVIVSNHGGRQLDGVPSAVSALPAVVDAVDGRAEVILDGGVRRGNDVLKALAIGAKACMIGRPFLYGLAANGGAGVRKALELLRAEIDVNLALLGRAGVKDLDRSVVSWAD